MAAMDIRLLRETLDVGAAVRGVTCAEAGGIDVFVGTTRAEQHGALGELAALEYQAYEEMALREMRGMAEEACRRWPVVRIAVWHRVGRVEVGEASVVIAVSCAHRAAAFEACRYVIEALKKSVPIWKKETYERESRWQGGAK